MSSIDNLIQTVKALREPDTGCPWDIEQNHQSIERPPHTVSNYAHFYSQQYSHAPEGFSGRKTLLSDRSILHSIALAGGISIQ